MRDFKIVPRYQNVIPTEKRNNVLISNSISFFVLTDKTLILSDLNKGLTVTA